VEGPVIQAVLIHTTRPIMVLAMLPDNRGRPIKDNAWMTKQKKSVRLVPKRSELYPPSRDPIIEKTPKMNKTILIIVVFKWTLFFKKGVKYV
jgi:hypothetical protein